MSFKSVFLLEADFLPYSLRKALPLNWRHYSNDAGLPCFCPHKVLITEIWVFRFHGCSSLWKSTRARVYMNTTNTWSQRYWHKKIPNLLMDMSKAKSFVFKKSWWCFNGSIQNTYTPIHVEKCLLPETRAFPSNKWTKCCLSYVLAQNCVGFTGMPSTDRCDQLVSESTVTTMRLTPNDTKQSP